MNHVSSKCLNRVLSHSTPRRSPSASRIARHTLPGLSAARAKSTKASANKEDREKGLAASSGKENNVLKEGESAERDDKPLPYQNTQSEWADSSFLSPYMRKYPGLYKAVKFVYDGMGLYAKQGDAVRIGKKVYMGCCERDFVEEKLIYDTCQIPRTFHSWFQITNLHVWLLTVRLRALPPPHGRLMLQALIDFFFADIEERLRSLLGKKISERTITGYMKEYRELWNGSQLALDIGLVGGDWELGGAVWRNLCDARGWDLGGRIGEDGQLLTPLSSTESPSVTSEQQALGLQSTPGSAAGPTGNLAELPLHMYTFTAYLRRELKRLEAVPDETIIQDGNVGEWEGISWRESGDEVPDQPLTEKELEQWKKSTEELGVYR